LLVVTCGVARRAAFTAATCYFSVVAVGKERPKVVGRQSTAILIQRASQIVMIQKNNGFTQIKETAQVNEKQRLAGNTHMSSHTKVG
jgi:hypothetical protein